MPKRILEPNTTLYPVAVVLITSGDENPNVMTCNRIISCSAEPPRLAISVRPSRYTHDLIRETGEFVVNIPTPEQSRLSDYLGVVSGREEDKIAITGLKLTRAVDVKTSLVVDCPVNIECGVESYLELDSHTMFVARVLAVHADKSVMDNQGDVDISLAGGITYKNGTVREKPTYKFRVKDLRQEQHR